MSALSFSSRILRNVLHFQLWSLKFWHRVGTILIGLRELLVGSDLLMCNKIVDPTVWSTMARYSLDGTVLCGL